MPISEKTLRAYEVQLRRIEEHRLKNAEKNIRRIYQALRKDLIAFLAMEYANNAEDDVLTFDVLYGKGRYARFLEETEKHIDSFTPETRAEITSLVNNTYKAVYAGLVDAVIKTKKVSDVQKELETVKAVRPEVLRRAVLNPVSGLTLPDRLEKRRREIIYDIKQQVGIGLSYGDRYSTIAKRISDSCEFNYTKAIRVARTESRRVLEMGLDDSANEIDTVIKNGSSGLIGVKTWRTMKDERVRPQRRVKTKSGWKTYKSKPNAPNHVKMEGQTVLTNELFDLGSGVKSKAPLQSGVAGHDINCRCFIEHDWLTPEEYAEVTKKEPSKTVDKSGDSSIIKKKVETAGNDVNYVGKIDREIYKCVTKDIVTEDVIITDNQITHIKERHPNDYERYGEYIPKILNDPDYILEANKPDTAFVLKSISENNKKFQLILRLKTKNDPEHYKNSIITFLKIKDKEWKRCIKNKKILYKKE